VIGKLGNSEPVLLAARAVQRLRADVVLRHDVRVERGEVHLEDVLMETHRGFEREAATVS